MAYFPFFVDLSRKSGLIIGGGTVALRKIEKLLPFSPKLQVIAPDICPEIRRIPDLELVERAFVPGDEQGAFFVIAATDDPDCNHQIADLCRNQNILVNVVDDAAYCSFLFPALVQKGNLSIGISTAGSSPTAAICLKEQIGAQIPECFDEILEFLHQQRERIKAHVPEEHVRSRLLRKLFYATMQNGGPLDEAQLKEFWAKEIAQ